MAATIVQEPPVSWPSQVEPKSMPYSGTPRNIDPINALDFPSSLQPKRYDIQGTHPESKILFTDVNILDSTGREPYHGDVLIKGERIAEVGHIPTKAHHLADPKVRVFEGRGRTLLSGLGDAHAHFSWNGSDLSRLGALPVEEHVLLAARSAQCFLDSGYTMAFGAASAKPRLDAVVRDAINAGDVGTGGGPRYLAAGQEICRRDGGLVDGITAFADGPGEMREVVREQAEGVGVDNVKLSMSGEEITEIRSAHDCYFTDEETAACVDEAHKRGKRICAHARARESVKMCARHDVDVIFHASYTDDEGMQMLEEKKTRIVVAPAINWLVATLNDAEAFGYPQEQAERVGYRTELNTAVAALREMHRRGIVILPGGDYGFAWTPHGTYARDLEHFVRLIGFTEYEAIIAATSGVAKLFMRENELGRILPGYYADCILVDGNPLDDISILQDHDKINIIVMNGRVHKAGRKEYVRDLTATPATSRNGSMEVVEYPEVKRVMQKDY